MHRKPEYRALTLNIHKGFSASNLRYTLEALRVVLRDSKCNVVFLQEVSGENSRYHKRIKGWLNTDQLEYLADSVGLTSLTAATRQPLLVTMEMPSSARRRSGASTMKTLAFIGFHNADYSMSRSKKAPNYSTCIWVYSNAKEIAN